MLEQTPENRALTAERVTRFLKKSGIWDISRDPASRNAFIQSLDPQIAEDFLERINGIIMGTPICQREIYEHARFVQNRETGEIAHSPAQPEFQKQILKKIILPTVKMLDPKDASQFAAASINLLHSFQDGNGRLARTIYFLMDPQLAELEEADAKKYLRDALGPEKRGINFNPAYIRGTLDKMIIQMSKSKDDKVYKVTGMENYDRITNESALLEASVGTDYVQRFAIARTIVEETFISFLGSREYIFAKPQEEIDSYLIPVPDSDDFRIDAYKLMDDMKDGENVTKWIGYCDVVRMHKFLALHFIFTDPEHFSSQEPGLNAKEFFEREAFEDYAEKVAQK